METKFIEGTDKKYSIREDGVVISHYMKSIKRDKILKLYKQKYSKSVTIKVNNVKQKVYIGKLLLSHFPIICKCKKCGKNFKKTITWSTYCSKKCTNGSNSVRLSDSYVIHRFNDKYSLESYPKELIEVKRNQILLTRKIKKHDKSSTNE